MADSGKGSPYKEAVAFKWGTDLLTEGFVPLPKRLLRCATQLFRGKLRLSELCAVLAIVDYQRPLVSRKPSLSHLASIAGLSEDRFRLCLKSLRKRGLVTWKGTENAIEFNYDGLKRKAIRLTSGLEDDDEGDDDGD